MRNPATLLFLTPIILAASCILVVRFGLGFQFPIPWPDETGFISQAFNLATTGSLFDAGMNPDRDVMWMPPGYMVVLAGVFRVLGYSFSLVRWLSAACVLASLLIAAFIATRLVDGWRRAAAGWVLGVAFASPSVLIDGNIGRMEALFCALMLLALAAGLAGRIYVMCALILGAACVHFNAIYFIGGPLCYVLPVLRRRVWPGWGGWAALAFSGFCLAAYAAYVMENWHGFVQDMALQFRLKAYSGLNDVDHPLWILLCAGALLAGVIVRRRRLDGGTLAGLFGLEFVAMAHFGHEIWYDYGQPLGFALLALGWLAQRPMPDRKIDVIGGSLAALLTIGMGCRITPIMASLMPRPAMLRRDFVSANDIARVRQFIATLHPGQTVDFGWTGMENFFLADLARAGARWTIIRHSVTQTTPFRPSDWRVSCDSSEVPASLRHFDISFQRQGVDSGCTILPGLGNAGH